MIAVSSKSIDFLPEKYRNATDRRRTSYWRVVVIALFLGAFAATAIAFNWHERGVRREHAVVAAQYAAAQTRQREVEKQEARVAALRVYADLVTFQRHPWPRSRLVEELFATLPTSAVIERFRIASEKRPVGLGGEGASGELKAERTAAADLADLRRAAELHDIVIRLEGLTDDQSALHEYVQRLSRGLFEVAEIESIEAVPSGETGRSRFIARIVVLPGWGLSRGPKPEEPMPNLASKSTVGELAEVVEVGTPGSSAAEDVE